MYNCADFGGSFKKLMVT